uniref:Uncharacterized protein n=1 Tax=Pseudomonas aeruginosa TaxID=287 RepID=A0A6C0L1K1_PSEAI|nr:hypothetical protein [Pseudomonas aeruginosa]
MEAKYWTAQELQELVHRQIIIDHSPKVEMLPVKKKSAGR